MNLHFIDEAGGVALNCPHLEHDKIELICEVLFLLIHPPALRPTTTGPRVTDDKEGEVR